MPPTINAPTENPTQSASKALRPAWRLANNVINATEQSLEASATSCEFWSWGCGGLLLVGLFLEVVIAALHPPYDSFAGTWGPVISDICVTIGVGGEIMFAFMGFRCQEELGRRAKKEVAALNHLAGEANERAAKAQLELERLKTPRNLSELQSASIAAKLSAFGGQEVLVIPSPATYEAALFADQIHRTFESAFLKSQRLERWLITGPSIIAQDVCVAFEDGDEIGKPLAKAIEEALSAEGIKTDTTAAKVGWWSAISGKALVVVGAKT